MSLRAVRAAVTPQESLMALMQLSSPALPVGSFSYSQGLEGAVDEARLNSVDDIATWIADVLEHVIGRYEAPLWWRLSAAVAADDCERFFLLDREFLASRETAELRAETLQMGHSLAQLARGLGLDVAVVEGRTWPAVHAWVADAWSIEPSAALSGYLFGWAENQVMAAIKSFAMGQRAGQAILADLRPLLARVVRQAATLPDDRLSTQAVGLAITSARHEAQYSRLFRS